MKKSLLALTACWFSVASVSPVNAQNKNLGASFGLWTQALYFPNDSYGKIVSSLSGDIAFEYRTSDRFGTGISNRAAIGYSEGFVHLEDELRLYALFESRVGTNARLRLTPGLLAGFDSWLEHEGCDYNLYQVGGGFFFDVSMTWEVNQTWSVGTSLDYALKLLFSIGENSYSQLAHVIALHVFVRFDSRF